MLADLVELVDAVAELLMAVTADDADSLLIIAAEESPVEIDMRVLIRLRDRVAVARMALHEEI